MDAATVLLILNILFVVFLIAGFLGGLCGAKKSTLKFVCFIVGIIIAALITPLVSSAVLKIEITYNNELTSIKDILLSLITQALNTSDMVSSNPAFAELLQNIPLMIGNLFVFIVLVYVVSLFSWVVYKVLASVFIKKDKYEVKDGKKVKIKSKKYRLVGGLIGLVQGMVLMFVTFFPISGLVGLVTELSQQTVVVAAEENAELTPTAKLLRENLPKEIMDIIEAYDKSIISKTTGVLGLDDACFNNVSSVKVNGYTISLRDEVVTISNIYDNVSYIFDLDFSSIRAIKQVDFAKLEKAINYVFDSNAIQSILPELVNYGFDELLKIDDVTSNKDYYDCISLIKKEFNTNNQVANNLKIELLSCVNIIETFVNTGVFDEVFPENNEVNINNILDLLSANNKKVYYEIIDEMFESKLLSSTSSVIVNKGVELLEKELSLTLEEEVNLGRIDISDETTVINKQDIKSMGAYVLNVYDVVKDINFDSVNSDFRILFNYNLGEAIINLGEAAEIFKNMPVFSSTGIYSNLMATLNKTQYNKYVDFEVFTTDSIWADETKLLAKVFNEIVESNALSYLDKTSEGSYTITDENISKFIACLAVSEEVDGTQKSHIRKILEPLFESKAFKKMFELGLGELGSIVNNMGNLIVEGGELGTLNTSDLYEEKERKNILDFFDNAVAYVKDIDIIELKEDPFMIILESDLARLGSALDSIKLTSLFGDNVSGDNVVRGVYSKLIELLKQTEYADYIGFDYFLQSDFSWNTELAATSDMIAILIDRVISTSIEEVPLIKYIIQGGDWEFVLEQISSEDLTNIFTPLLESKIFEPTAVMALNKINEEIKNIVGDFGNIIPNIEDIPAEEIGQIVEIVTDVADLIEEFTKEDFDITTLATGENKEKLSSLLNSMQDNANNNGVFEQTYNSLVDYVSNDETIGSQVVDLISGYEDGQIDWVNVINQLIA